MNGPRSPQARRALELFDGAPRGDRFHVRARWWSAPVAAVEREVPVAGRVLEVGCGHGLVSLYLALSSSARSVHGVDVDEHKIALARAAAANLEPGEATVSFAVGSSPDPPPPDAPPSDTTAADADGPWDAVVVVDVLYLLPAAARRRLLAGCAAALAPGGVLVIKELDTSPAWKHRLAVAQETVATRVLRYTQGEAVEMTPVSVLAGELTRLGLRVTTRRVDRSYPHAHALLIGLRYPS